MYCDCKKAGKFKKVEVDEEGICQNCGYYAVKNPKTLGKYCESRDLDDLRQYRDYLRNQDLTVKDYVRSFSGVEVPRKGEGRC